MEFKHHQVFKLSCCASLGMLIGSSSPGAEPPKAPVPKSPYIAVVYRYADTMLERGRDTDGPRKTGLFLSALDRTTMSALTNRPAAPEGVHEKDRVGSGDGPLTGSNPQHDQNLLRIMYTLSELSAKPKYRQVADGELKWFLQNTNSGLGSTDSPFRPWMLWGRCFELGREASKALANARAAQETQESDSARGAGFQIRTCAEAYAATHDKIFLERIEKLVPHLETQLAGNGRSSSRSNALVSLSLAIDATGASRKVPEPLAGRLELLGTQADQNLLARAPLKIAATANALWKTGDSEETIAQIGMLYVSRYDNTGNVGYRDLLVGAADAYLGSFPEKDVDVWPATLGHSISLELAAWRHTARPIYLERARKLADWAVQNFWGTSALPRASLKAKHYESITGADTLALALLELHLQVLHITAVRCPPNTIDR
jgi:hypothetical protein